MVTELEVKIPMIDFRKRKAKKVDEGLAKRSKINHFIQQVDGNNDDVNDTAPGWLCYNCFDVLTRKSSLCRHMKSCEQAKSDYYTVDIVEEKKQLMPRRKTFFVNNVRKAMPDLTPCKSILMYSTKCKSQTHYNPPQRKAISKL